MTARLRQIILQRMSMGRRQIAVRTKDWNELHDRVKAMRRAWSVGNSAEAFAYFPRVYRLVEEMDLDTLYVAREYPPSLRMKPEVLRHSMYVEPGEFFTRVAFELDYEKYPEGQKRLEERV